MSKLLMLALVLAAFGCKPESARKAERAAKEVTEQRDELREAVTESKDIGTEAKELASAQSEFERRRDLRVQTLRAEHSVIASQRMLIGTMTHNFPITDAGRAEINEKLKLFQMRLDEAANLIQALQTTGPDLWESRDDAATEAMNRLETAREEAWEALDDAPKTDDRSAS